MGITNRIGHHEVDWSAEQALEILLEAEIRAKGIRCTWRELDENVHVAAPGVKAVAGCRAKQAKALDAVRATGTGDRLTVQNQGGAHSWILTGLPEPVSQSRAAGLTPSWQPRPFGSWNRPPRPRQ